MSYTIKAAALSRVHLGSPVQVSRGEMQIVDTLRGVTHEANLIEDRKMFDEFPTFICGRVETTLMFANAGTIQINGDADVEIGKP